MQKQKRSTISVLSMADGNSLFTLATNNKSNSIVVAMSNGYEVFASTISGYKYMNSSFECKLLPFWKQHHFPPVCGQKFETGSQPVELVIGRQFKGTGYSYVLKALALLALGACLTLFRLKRIRIMCTPLWFKQWVRRLRGTDEAAENPFCNQMKWLLPQELHEREFIQELLKQLKVVCKKRRNINVTIEVLPASECLAQKDQGLLLFPVINASRVGTDIQTAFDSTRIQAAAGAHEEHTHAVVVVFKSHAPHVTPFPNTQEKLFEMRSQVIGFVDVVFHQNTIYDHKANDAAVDKLFELSKEQ